MNTTAVKLRLALWRRGLTITAAANTIGVRRERLSRILNGREPARVGQTLGQVLAVK